MLRSGCVHAFWPDAVTRVSEHTNRTGVIMSAASQQLRRGVLSTLTLLPLGVGVHVRDDDLGRGLKLAPKAMLGIAIGYDAYLAIKILVCSTTTFVTA